MVRIALLVAVLAALASPAAATIGGTHLRVTYWPAGQGNGPARSWTLDCAPGGGSLPQAAAACSKLARMRNPFAVPPKDQICTEIYGGPQEAVVAGRFEGRRIWIRLARRNGCEIARFNRLRFLVPAFTGREGPK